MSLSEALRLIGDDRLADQAAAVAAEVDAFAATGIDDGAEQLAVLSQALAGLAERIAVRHFSRQTTRRGVEATGLEAR